MYVAHAISVKLNYISVIIVAAAAVATLEITADSVTNFNPFMDANFPFDTPLVIRALDTGGYVVTDGPDANLVR